jgi:hypothetical protein
MHVCGIKHPSTVLSISPCGILLGKLVNSPVPKMTIMLAEWKIINKSAMVVPFAVNFLGHLSFEIEDSASILAVITNIATKDNSVHLCKIMKYGQNSARTALHVFMEQYDMLNEVM